MPAHRKVAPARAARYRLGLISAALAASLSGLPGAHAASLLEAWRSAREADPELTVARAARSVGEARALRADTLWRPQVALSATAGLARSETTVEGARFSAPPMGTISDASFRTAVQGPSGQFALSLRQPLWNPELSAVARQLALSSEGASLQWQSDTQAAMLRLAEHWLTLGLASERVRTVVREQAALERALTEATARWQAGDEPVLGMHEARARLESVRARQIAARSDRDTALSALADLTGLPPQVLDPAAPGRIRSDPAAPLDQWLARAGTGNLAARALALAVQVSGERAAQTARGSGASLDLLGRASIDRMTGHGDYASSASSGATQGLVGLSLSMPLYTGGQREAQHEEAVRQVDQARAELERTRRTVARETRAAWQRLDAGHARVTALEQALVAAGVRLGSTRTGREVGDRTTLDVLNAESELAQVELTLTEARASLLLDRLRLARLAGTLDESDLAALEAALAAR
jgi:outer membrane protein